MQSGEPSEASGQENPPAGEDTGGELTEAILSEPTATPEPLFKGDAHILWSTAGAFLAIFFIVIVIIMRMNARAAVRKRSLRPPGEFFQPAGQGAEITFDDEEPVAASASEEAPAPSARPTEKEEAPASPGQKKGFGGLFGEGKKTSKKDEHSLSEGATVSDRQARETGERPRTHPLAEERRAKFESDRNSSAQASAAGDVVGAQGTLPQSTGFDEKEPTAPRYTEDEAARARRQVEEEFRRIEEERRAVAEHTAEFERHKQLADLEQQRQAVEQRGETLAGQASALERRIDELRRDLADELNARFAAQENRFDERMTNAAVSAEAGRARAEETSTALYDLERRMSVLAGRLDEQAGSAANDEQISAIANLVARRIFEQRESMDAALASLSERVDALAARALKAENAQQKLALGGRQTMQSADAAASAPIVQLTEIIRNALPSDAYEMRSALSNNRRADCLVRLPNPPGPVAIDAQFPVDAFYRLRSGDSAGDPAAESEFRRAVLRHIADIAERLILPGETADSALMFVPSESIYSQIHSRFPDLVQDSYRAHVWIVSPTTMMAALHTMYAALANLPADRSGPDGDAVSSAVMADLSALRARVASLEDRLAVGTELKRVARADEPSPTSASEPAADEATSSDASQAAKREPRKDSSEGDLWNDEQTSEQPNAPFPLR